MSLLPNLRQTPMSHFHDVALIRPGQRWFSADGSGHSVYITNVEQYGTGKWDYTLHYDWYVNGKTERAEKNAWDFQVRYFNRDLDASYPPARS